MSKRLTLALSTAALGAVLFGAAACDDDPDPPKDGGVTTDTGVPDGGTKPDTVVADTGGTADVTPGNLGNSSGAWVVYANPFGDGRANPAMNIGGWAKADSAAGGMMTLTLEVTGVTANMTFGSHLHKLDCNDNKAGGHYQHNAAPDQDAGGDAGGPADPMYANPNNEAWLDFTTNGTGKGLGTTTVAWIPEMAKAKSIIVHAMKTGDGGLAGAKLACLPFAFK